MKLNLPEYAVRDRVSNHMNLGAYQKVTIAELEGAGCIQHIYLAPGRDPMIGRNVIVRMYFDGEEVPYVEAPVGDFFGVMHGENFYPIDTEYIAVLEETGYNCYFEMPFGKGARIEVETGGRPAAVYIMVDWQRYPDQEMQEEYRFCARWRHEKKTERYGKDFLILDAAGPGCLLGFAYGVRLYDNTDRWSHGGAENIYIDGQGNDPAFIRGIGGEDTFGTSYGGALHHPETRLYSAMPYYTHEDIGEARPAQRVTGYRFYAKDPIQFRQSIQMRFGCMSNDICSTAYWYAKSPVRDFYRMPAADRLLPKTIGEGTDLPLPDSGSWSMIGPFPMDYDISLKDFVEDPENLSSGKTFRLETAYHYGPDDRDSAAWTRYPSIHGFVDFRHWMRVRKRGVSPTEDGFGIAVCELNCKHAGTARLDFSWDDALAVYVNGKTFELGSNNAFRKKQIEAELKEGKNTLAVLLTNTLGYNHGGWCFAFRAVDKAGEEILPNACVK